MSLARNTSINTLPGELLLSIFIALVNNITHTQPVDEGHTAVDSSTLISSVCPYWRRIATNTPYLWTSIDVLRSDHSFRQLEAINLWLERSQNLPLRVRIGKGLTVTNVRSLSLTESNELVKGFKKQLNSVVCSCMPRLHSITLKCYHPTVINMILSILGAGAATHAITELIIGQVRHDRMRGQCRRMNRHMWVPTTSRLLLEGLDSLFQPLRILHLEGVEIYLDTIPCRNLVELRLLDLHFLPSKTALATLLRANSNLEGFIFRGNCSTRPPLPTYTRPIELLSLRSINVETGAGILDWLFSSLVMGDHDLSLCIRVTSNDWDGGSIELGDTLASFFRQAQVKSLFMGGDWPELPPLIVCLPHLQHLGLDLSTIFTKKLDGIESTSGAMFNLCTIEIDRYYPTSDQIDTSLCFLLSLPSVQQIMLRSNAYYAEPVTQERVLILLSKEGITAPIVVTNESKIPAVSQPSPFVA